MKLNWFAVLLIGFSAGAQELPVDSLVSRLKGQDDLVDKVLDNQEDYKLQFILTVPKGEKDTELIVDASSNDYYYPASLVKLPTVLATLEIMKDKGFQLDDYIVLSRDEVCGSAKFVALTQKSKLTFRKLIEETIVVSDNHYYNVLYHFATPRVINAKLKSKGIQSTNIYRCFSGCDRDGQLHTNGFKIYNVEDSLIYTQTDAHMDWDEVDALFLEDSTQLVGKRVARHGNIYNEPYYFNQNLEFPLQDLHKTVMSFVTELDENMNSDWDIRLGDRDFLLDCMSMFPADVSNEKYHNRYKYPKNEFKIIAFGDLDKIKPNVVTYGKIGYSYGFITESAYVLDTVTNVSFYLSISMYVNKNGTINDGRYEFNTVATPFMGRFTNLIIEYIEEKRMRSSE
jgi:DNA-binding MarR family transcriptional regulator